MIQIQQLTKEFSGKCALDIQELTFQQGECIGIVGNNGAGKTTLFRTVLDLLPPSTGSVEIFGQSVKNSDHWKTGVHAFVDEGFLIDFLKPIEYLEFIGKTIGAGKQSVAQLLEEYSEFVNDDIRENRKMIRELSTGSKVRVGVLSTLLGNPKLIILDEPFAHLDPTSQSRLMKMVRSKAEEGVTMILSSHNLQSVVDVCSRIVLIEAGQVKMDVRTDSDTLEALEAYFVA
ncbi:MAG: ABC transporter ATP-binding protein [Cytophagales bacterium]|nr:ABC transporter ATP-binding protein [Cytophagales bacterium]